MHIFEQKGKNCSNYAVNIGCQDTTFSGLGEEAVGDCATLTKNNNKPVSAVYFYLHGQANNTVILACQHILDCALKYQKSKCITFSSVSSTHFLNNSLLAAGAARVL
jgi:hypothetical protein